MPYINQRPEKCSSCDMTAVVVIVTKFNGFVICACADHLVQVADIIKKRTESIDSLIQELLDTLGDRKLFLVVDEEEDDDCLGEYSDNDCDRETCINMCDDVQECISKTKQEEDVEE